MMTRKELTESLKRRADAAARQDAVMPILRKTKAGGWTRGSVNVDAAGVMYDLPADMRAGTFGNSGKTMRIPVETTAKNVRVIPTRGTRVGAGSVAAAVVPLAIDALMRSVPAARRTEARNYLRTASEVGKLPEKPGIGAVLSTGARLFFGDFEGAKRGERLWDPIGKNADEKEMAERYGRGSGTGNRRQGSGFRVQESEEKHRTSKGAGRVAEGAGAMGVTENRWSDAARAASLAVRKAKVATRAVGKVGSGSGSDSKKTGYGKQVTTKHGMPQKFLPPTGPATQALVEWVNVKTGERWTAPSGGYRPPNEDWVPVTGGAAATIRKPGPPAATRVVRGQPPPVIRSPRPVKREG
jgi:hypothetical protein